jgi:peptidoglycan/xylan/chitin deacetylase (PgdA/CDA1 family)
MGVAMGLAAAALSIAGAVLYWAFRFASSSKLRPFLGRMMVWQVQTLHPHVALTFDDGPHPDFTERFLEALGEHRATFFVLGSSIRRWPHLGRAVVAAGHEIACHGDTHRTMTRAGPRATRDELRAARAAIVEATGRAPRFYRPAYGRFNLASWIEAPRLGMQRTMWSAGAADWKIESTPEVIALRILQAARPGAILLLHDADGEPGAPENTLRAVPPILEGLRARGLTPVTLSDLVAGGSAVGKATGRRLETIPDRG